MVNKVALGLLLAVVGGGIAAGTYIGFQYAGSADRTIGPAGAGTTTATPTATPTPAPTPTPTATPMSSQSIDRAAVETAVADRINAERRSRGQSELYRLDALREMARFHSENMATQGYPSHAAEGYNTAERYERFDLADRCRFPDDTGTGTREDDAIEVYERVTAGPDGTTADELAATIVSEWFDDSESETILTYENANQLGVGAAVTDEGRVYVTVDLC
ncbi:hypothetical protein BRD04_01745 [Halobacteriales archaeon QS_9_67_17]|nr:MAG: hypothetical protein BRD04_01745 [Halobacteriales archaeon QS_9_67_17]